MSDADLVKELRQQARNRTERFGDGSESVTAEWRAADRIEALAAEVERLRANAAADRGIRIALARDRSDEMKHWKARVESAESALAEAVEIMRPLCKAVLPFTLNGDCTMVKAGTVKAARDFITAQEKEKGK